MLLLGVRLGRLLLAAVFVYAAWTKLAQPWELFALSIDSYGLLPEGAVILVARALPWLELGLGLALVAGTQLVAVSAAVSLLLVAFMGAMLRAWWMDLGIDCGCFGIGQAVSPETLLRDGALTLLSLTVTAGAFALSARASRPGAGDAGRTGPVPAAGARWARTGARVTGKEWREDNGAGLVWLLGGFVALGVLACLIQMMGGP
jgi:uncharacterized membrane protein YphA (DoxX/SURF4 family)